MNGAPREHRVSHDGIELASFEWNEAARGLAPTILLAHATGFHSRCWDPVVSRLGDRHVIANDARGHGRSGRPDITSWSVFGSNLAALAQHFQLDAAIGVGHSMGGHALVDAGAAEPSRFASLLLIDPVIAAPETCDRATWVTVPEGTVHPTAKRKNKFASSAAMIERFEDRIPYSLFTPEALAAYRTYVLRPAPDGDGFELACPPTTEASIYMTARTKAGIFESVGEINAPVRVIRARHNERLDMMDFTTSPTWHGLAGAFANGSDESHPELSHFIPMQDPDLTVHRILGLTS